MVDLNVDIVWSKLLDKIKDKLTSLSYNTWFKETELYKLNDNNAYIIVPMPIHKNHLKDNYSDLISSNLFDITNVEYNLVFLLKEEIDEKLRYQLLKILEKYIILYFYMVIVE